MADLPEVVLVTRTVDGCDLVEALALEGAGRLEVPLGSRVAVEYEAGATPPVVHVELLASRVRYRDRSELQLPTPLDPDDQRTRQLLLAAGRVLRGGHVAEHVRAELAAAGDPDTSDVSGLGRLCEEHALSHPAPTPPLGHDTVPPGGYRTRSGRVLTEADLDALVAEAERGYAVDVDAVLTEAGLQPAARPVPPPPGPVEDDGPDGPDDGGR